MGSASLTIQTANTNSLTSNDLARIVLDILVTHPVLDTSAVFSSHSLVCAL